MTSKEVISVATGGAIGSAEYNAIGISVLVVDCNSTCLAIVSKMLHASGYIVITATHAADAMCILREREDELDLILTEVHLPDMDKYELLETMGEISSLPIVILSADNDENAMLGCLFKGAQFYLLKPITMNDIKNLWQFSKIKKQEEEVVHEGSTSCEGGSPPYDLSNEESYHTSLSNVLEQNSQKNKRKEPEEVDRDKDVDSDNSTLTKKPKLIWTNELHEKFLQAIRTLGIDHAHPKKILKHMNVPELKKENISSHLQKYRLTLRREQDAIERTMLGDHGETFKFVKPQVLMTNMPEFSQKNLNWYMPSLYSDSNHDDIQIPKQSDEAHSTCSSGSHGIKSCCSNEELGIFDPVRIDNSEESMKQKSTPADVGNCGFEGANDCMEFLGNSSQQQQQFMLPSPPLSPPIWQQQGNDILDAEMGDYEQLFPPMFGNDDAWGIFDYPL